jgi:hypothetical protein
MRFAAVLGLVLAAGCSDIDRTTPPTAERPNPRPPVRAEAPLRQTPVPAARPASDQCQAANFAYLVGRPKREIPVPVNPEQRRVACTTCPITDDFRPWRLNIFYDQATGLVTEVRCG